jgi:myo-inositol-1(or 4)-monophosphatase
MNKRGKASVNIEILRTIGKKLLQEIPPQKKFLRLPLGIGASGDKTYPIDKFAEDIILAGLDESGESLTIISEEAGVKDMRGGGRRVLIDPIDGSRNAVAGIPFFCTSIAVAEGDTVGDMELAYVVNLVNGDEFWAEKGRGAFLNSEMIHAQQDEVFYLTAYEAQSPHRDITRIIPLLSESRKTRCLGATALDLSYLAAGAISVFANPSPSRSFDFAGGWLLIKEAGGVFTDMNGDPIDAAGIGLKKSVSLLASGNRLLHEKALHLLHTLNNT